MAPEGWIGPISFVHNDRRSRLDRMRPLPKGCRNGKGIDSLLVPPGAFIAAPMQLAADFLWAASMTGNGM
jgi:hypothetical protein